MTLASFKAYCFNVLIGIDQLANTLIGGQPDETISSRCYRNSQKYWYARIGRVLIDTVFRLVDGPDHCKQAYQNELNHSQSFNRPCAACAEQAKQDAAKQDATKEA